MSFTRVLFATTVAAAAAAAAAACTSAPGAGSTISVSASQPTLVADGFAQLDIAASITPANTAAVLGFEVSGIGVLSATTAKVENGVAHIKLIAPTEDELSDDNAVTTVTARLVTRAGTPIAADVSGSTKVSYTVPTEGPPKIKARAVPDRVLAGGADPIKIIIEGRRLTSTTVTLTTSSADITVPASVTLVPDAAGGPIARGEVDVPATAQRAAAVVSIEGGGAVATKVDLHFIEPGDPEFDLTGTFAQITYGKVKITNFGLLKCDPEVVVSNTVSLIKIAQDGSQLSLTAETCTMDMPSVEVNLISHPITPRVGAGFVHAMNIKNPGALTFDLQSVAAGAEFDVPHDALSHPITIGATLAHENDPLPSSKDAPQQSDDDGDQNPGVTIGGDGGLVPDQYLCSRTTTTSMTGKIVSSDQVDGIVESVTETKMFSGDGGGPTVTGLPSEYHLQRVDGINGAPDIGMRDGVPGVSCTDIKRYTAELLAKYPSSAGTAGACQ